MIHANAYPHVEPGLFQALGSRLAAGLAVGLVAGLAANPAVAGPAAGTAVQVRDDQGRTISLAAPARRAVTLAPHATELVYAAGAGDHVIATIRGSDYPPAARQLPVIGDGTQPDPERVAAVRPDLLIAWQPGAAAPLARVMDKLGVPVFYSDPLTLAAIPDAVERMGALFGTEAQARPAAQALRARLEALAARYAGRRPVRVFVQAGLDPIYTLNDSSIVSDALRVCGGVNVFGQAPVVAPQVSLESVLAARPEAVLAGISRPEDAARNLAAWQALGLPAARLGHVYGVDADALYRPGPRLIDAAEAICADLDRLR
ncbi:MULTISPECIES: cobalamin-binding protein [Achromobacter]|jgi:iron complex transport system substrate-binding protein/vitamin B12 transport system substrate-binding protein|uniref:Vitamin B12-binding protein n=1 Tax=Achromobacter insolitus TaxID=217204 RepID=A0A6S7FBQ7_9BURK|nr:MULTISPECIES: cobalamin-binding protein [Achromobacter]AXA74233.1 cobalamin-binding protein [Achromobacter insolitus]MCP1400856.1 iron complex transport system substrate-binding protein/vitamin B12 transport system substrate-binding protein [Achromobacter insolitus]MEB3095264.1 cobalamin-binding protein [Achromobacter sp. D10]NGT16287.1 cobalamin-binding protein [Achromobacter insolitus]CAB3932517.1 Vitamin B12-binding protein [Achromobacter insolitus]